MTPRTLRGGAVVLLAAASHATLGAQSARADSLLNVGALQRAESLYYAAVQARPRDPMARWALGRYLVSRGAPRVGATLFEEALQFGGDAAVVGADLAPLYLSLGEYHKLSALRTSPLTNNERERARWLVTHSTKLTAPDSTSVLPYRRSTEAGALGLVTVRINGRSVDATISARERGIVISDTSAVAKRLRTFKLPSEARASGVTSLPGVLDSIAFGRFSIADYPVTVRALSGAQQIVIGIDVIARFAPTFDPKTERLTLRVSGTIPRSTSGADEVPTLLTRTDLRVLQAGGWMPIDQPQVARMLTTRRWTFDARRGQLTIER